jgi:hypothetical protein
MSQIMFQPAPPSPPPTPRTNAATQSKQHDHRPNMVLVLGLSRSEYHHKSPPPSGAPASDHTASCCKAVVLRAPGRAGQASSYHLQASVQHVSKIEVVCCYLQLYVGMTSPKPPCACAHSQLMLARARMTTLTPSWPAPTGSSLHRAPSTAVRLRLYDAGPKAADHNRPCSGHLQ